MANKKTHTGEEKEREKVPSVVWIKRKMSYINMNVNIDGMQEEMMHPTEGGKHRTFLFHRRRNSSSWRRRIAVVTHPAKT